MLNGSEMLKAEWNESAFKEEPYVSKVIYSVSLLIVFCASLIGNILTCIVIYCDKSMHTATNYYLFNLAVSDLLATFPILIISYEDLTEEGYIIEFKDGVWSCKFFLCLHYMFTSLFWTNGILVMTALSIERYIAICFPMLLQATSAWKRVGKIIYAIWMIAIIETVPLFWTMDIIDTGKSLMCFSMTTLTVKVLMGVSAVTTFILPLCIMTFVYTMIALKVRNNQKYNMKNITIPKNCFRAQNVNKLIVALTASFVVCWLPLFIITFPITFTDIPKQPQFQRWYMTLHKFAMFSSWCTTVLNPVLFSIMSIKFRKSLKMLWGRKIKIRYHHPRKSETVNTSTQQNSQHIII